MYFKEDIERDIFNKFIESSELANFAQTYEWGQFKALAGWEPYHLGLFNDEDKLVAATLLIAKKIPLIGKSFFYAPRGFIIDYTNYELLNKFTNHVVSFVKKQKGITLKIDPCYKYRQYDMDANLLKDGFDNEHIINNLKNIGFGHKGVDKYFGNTQPQYTLVADISKSLDEISKSFHKKTSYNIRLAEKKGVEIIKGNREQLKIFHEIMKITGERDEFSIRSLGYFEQMYDALYPSGNLEFFLAKYNINQGIENIKISIEREREKEEETNNKIADLKAITNKTEKDIKKLSKLENKIDNITSNINKLEKDLEMHLNKREKYSDEVYLSGAIAVKSGINSWYLYGASKNIFRNLMANYLIQWEMIKWAKDKDCTVYDMRGISPDLNPENHIYGLYKFKRGFCTEFVEYIGEFDYPIKPIYSYLFEKLLPKVVSVLKHIRR